MNKLLLFLFPLLLLAQDKSPQEIQEELNHAEAQFEHAKELFNPWYAGPLITGSASMMPPGMANIQPYIFVTDTYAVFNEDRHSVDIPDIINANPLCVIQTGITSWMDTILTVQGDENWQGHRQSGGLGDTTLQLGLKILKQGLWIPAMKIYLNETFPSGRYQNFSSGKAAVSSTGAGAYTTSFSLNTSKILFWDTLHPTSLRLSLNYYIPTSVHVRGFNAYGGGFGTSGTVHPGQTFKLSFGTEISLTQRWVIANDLVYQTSGRTTFTGNLGVDSTGAPAVVGNGSNDSLSLAPALEYNFTPQLGALAGVWFTVYGRNSSNFISGIFTVTYTFSW